jgi:hypothetical protein
LATALLVTAADADLPAMLGGLTPRATFTNAEHLRAVLSLKPGSMVIVLDETQADLVAGLRRTDVRAVALVTPRAIPVIFRQPIVAVVERPLLATSVVAAIHRALAELWPQQGGGGPAEKLL